MRQATLRDLTREQSQRFDVKVSAVPPPQTMFGRYELLTLLARGGMAEVHLAQIRGARGFAKRMVVKRVLPHLIEDPEFLDMFLNEARIAARLSHPNICQVFELGEVDGSVFLAMEYLDGVPWSELVRVMPRRRCDDTLRCVTTVLLQICEGLRHAHEFRDSDGSSHPIVHRDVTPHNLFVTRDGVCKLLDFGVAKVLTENSRTRTGMLKGKLPYMAPEQIRGEEVDARADVFSIGVVLWEALTGQRLFSRSADYQIWRAVTEEPIPSVSSVAPGFPGEIDGVVSRALERDVAKRYASIASFAADLRRVAATVGGPLEVAELAQLVVAHGGQPPHHRLTQPAPEPHVVVGADPPSVRVTPTPAESTQLRSESMAFRRAPRRRVALWIGTAAVVALIGGAVGVVVTSSDGNAHAVDHTRRSLDERAASDASSINPVDASEMRTPAEQTPQTSTVVNANVDAAPTHPQPAKKKPARATPQTGTYSVDSKPYATIYVDGKSYGETPLFKVPLMAGQHSVRAVRVDGKVRQLTITIKPATAFSSGTLVW